MLSADAIPPAPQPNDPPLPSLDIADHPGYEPFESSRSRLRIVIKKSDGMWSAETLPGGNPIPEDISATLKLPFEKTTLIFNALKGADLRVRLVQPVDFDDEGDAVKSIVILAPAPKDKKKENQSLADHVGEVKTHAIRIANALEIDDSIRAALIFAARWHDEGKKARIWQTFANNPDPNAPPLGKMAQSRDPKSLKHYRHEFGSLLRIHHPDRCDKIDCTLPSDEPTRNIAIHLIATHHGGGRPHFPVAVYDPFNDDERDALHTESIRRFAQLQQKYGWWHLAWLENLLRCADQLASADEEVTEIDELERGER